jgi:flagellar M-ring protein FliF
MQEPTAHTVRPSLSDRWRSLNARGKLVIGVAIAAVVAGLFGVVLWASRPDYVMLYRDLSPEDMQAIENNLYASQDKFKVSMDGSSILVPSSDKYRIRMRLANSGLPEGGANIETKSKFGMTDRDQKEMYRAQLEDELAGTIASIMGISSARVHVVQPRETVFIENEQKAKASVVLKLRPGMKLSPGQVDGVVHLVACSVGGLERENVAVLDTSGVMLSSPNKDSLVDSSRLEFQRSVESDLALKAQTMLNEVLGPNNAVIRVTADIDFSASDMTDVTYNPEGTATRSEQDTEHTSKGTALKAIGTPGVTTGVMPNSQMSGNLPEYTSSDIITENEVSRKITTTNKPPGEIRKLSVSVAVDHKIVNDVPVPLTQQDLQDIESLVGGAVGLDKTRGDSLEVKNIPFDTSLPKAMQEAEKNLRWANLQEMLIKAGIAVLAAIFLLFLLRSIRKRRPAEQTLALPGYTGYDSIGASDSEAPRIGASGAVSAARAVTQGKVPEDDQESEIQVSPIQRDKQQILSLLAKDPLAVAQVIRDWMSN